MFYNNVYLALQFIGFVLVYINKFMNQIFLKIMSSNLDYKLDEKDKDKYSIISYNINYGYYLGHQHLDSIINKLRFNDIDIVCLQEVTDRKTHEYIKKYSGYKYSIFHNKLSIFSNSKIDNITIYDYSDTYIYKYPTTSLILCKLIIDSEELYIINTHLTPDISGFKQSKEINELKTFIILIV